MSAPRIAVAVLAALAVCCIVTIQVNEGSSHTEVVLEEGNPYDEGDNFGMRYNRDEDDDDTDDLTEADKALIASAADDEDDVPVLKYSEIPGIQNDADMQKKPNEEDKEDELSEKDKALLAAADGPYTRVRHVPKVKKVLKKMPKKTGLTEASPVQQFAHHNEDDDGLTEEDRALIARADTGSKVKDPKEEALQKQMLRAGRKIKRHEAKKRPVPEDKASGMHPEHTSSSEDDLTPEEKALINGADKAEEKEDGTAQEQKTHQGAWKAVPQAATPSKQSKHQVVKNVKRAVSKAMDWKSKFARVTDEGLLASSKVKQTTVKRPTKGADDFAATRARFVKLSGQVAKREEKLVRHTAQHPKRPTKAENELRKALGMQNSQGVSQDAAPAQPAAAPVVVNQVAHQEKHALSKKQTMEKAMKKITQQAAHSAVLQHKDDLGASTDSLNQLLKAEAKDAKKGVPTPAKAAAPPVQVPQDSIAARLAELKAPQQTTVATANQRTATVAPVAKKPLVDARDIIYGQHQPALTPAQKHKAATPEISAAAAGSTRVHAVPQQTFEQKLAQMDRRAQGYAARGDPSLAFARVFTRPPTPEEQEAAHRARMELQQTHSSMNDFGAIANHAPTSMEEEMYMADPEEAMMPVMPLPMDHGMD